MTISEIIVMLTCGLVIGSIISFSIKYKKNDPTLKYNKLFEGGFKSQADLFQRLSEMQSRENGKYQTAQQDKLFEIQKRLDDILKGNEEKLTKIIDVINFRLESLQKNNESKLEQMRQTVDEKLHATLDKRFSESFNAITQQIESFSKGIGEMQSLALGVGDLKRVLTNVKTRGMLGEMSLDNLLGQILTKDQYAKGVTIKKNSQEKVDFAILLPGNKNDQLFLPIDAKFPIEDYQKLCDASERGNLVEIEDFSKALEKRVKEEAKSICEKYINIPLTTDFALLYLPIEGLYAEIIKRPGLVENLQHKYKIIVCGPTTLSALLSSLQMGFRTLAIEKHTSEVWKLLGTFKQEFGVFASLLTKTQKKLEEATNTIDDATKRTNIINRKLNKISSSEAESLLIEEIPANEDGEE